MYLRTGSDLYIQNYSILDVLDLKVHSVTAVLDLPDAWSNTFTPHRKGWHPGGAEPRPRPLAGPEQTSGPGAFLLSCFAQVKFFRSLAFHSPYSRTPSRGFGAPSLGGNNVQSESEEDKGLQFPFPLR